MGASSYTYAEASWTQTLPDWIGSHVRALAFMGGVPAQLVPDNPKVGVTRANWYEPGLNRTYLDLATHYGTAILPARPRRPRDKAKVEVGVLVVERWILARLRNRRFFALSELNQAIGGPPSRDRAHTSGCSRSHRAPAAGTPPTAASG
jgi:transposase